jgi:protoporphyrin/coproporphyrin ferrochelatase
MISPQSQSTNLIDYYKDDSAALPRVAVLLVGYGEVQSYGDLNQYNQAATRYIAAQFVAIPECLYPLAGWLLTLQDLYNFAIKHDRFTSPENIIFEQQRLGIETNLRDRWGNQVQVFKGFYFCEPFVQAVVADIIQQKFQHLLIYPLLVVDSAFTGKIALTQVNEVIATSQEKSAQSPFQSMRYIPAFATEKSYADLIVRQLRKSLHQPSLNPYAATQIGLILTVHGGPEKANGLLTGVIDGQALYDRVEAQLCCEYPLCSIGWINHDTPFIHWSEPSLKQAAASLIKSGAKVIVFKPIGWATENYETILDVDDVIQSLRQQYPTVTYTRLACVNDDPDFLKIAAEWADPHISAMLSVSKRADRAAITGA